MFHRLPILKMHIKNQGIELYQQKKYIVHTLNHISMHMYISNIIMLFHSQILQYIKLFRMEINA